MYLYSSRYTTKCMWYWWWTESDLSQ